MARPIMFSKVFPVYHPRAGEPTLFAEKIWKFLSLRGDPAATLALKKSIKERNLENASLEELIFPKSHTIRRGHRWTEIEKFSPRHWSGAPYASKHLRICDDLLICNVWEIIILPSGEVFIDGKPFGFYGSPEIAKLAYHDGLHENDFRHWFNRLPLEGQIICWDEGLQYFP